MSAETCLELVKSDVAEGATNTPRPLTHSEFRVRACYHRKAIKKGHNPPRLIMRSRALRRIYGQSCCSVKCTAELGSRANAEAAKRRQAQ